MTTRGSSWSALRGVSAASASSAPAQPLLLPVGRASYGATATSDDAPSEACGDVWATVALDVRPQLADEDEEKARGIASSAPRRAPNQHTVLLDSHHTARRRGRAARRVACGGLALAALGAVLVVFGTSGSGSYYDRPSTAADSLAGGAPTSLRRTEPPLVARESYTNRFNEVVNCTRNIERGSRFTPALCAEPDGRSAAKYCAPGSTCHALCGDFVDQGIGALCAVTALTQLSTVCTGMGYCGASADVAALKDDLAAAVAANLDALILEAPDAPSSYDADRAAPDWSTGQYCDAHLYCNFCLHSETCSEIACQSDDAMEALNHLDAHCRGADRHPLACGGDDRSASSLTS